MKIDGYITSVEAGYTERTLGGDHVGWHCEVGLALDSGDGRIAVPFDWAADIATRTRSGKVRVTITVDDA